MTLHEPRRLGLRSVLAEHAVAPSLIAISTGVYLTIGVGAFAAYRFTGNDAWVTGFFRIPGALLAVFLALAQIWFTVQVYRQFGPLEPMHTVWLCLSGAAVLDFGGALCSQVLGASSALNPLRDTPWWSDGTIELLRQYGWLLGGTCRFALLAVGLALAMNVFRGAGLRLRMQPLDWVVWVAMGAYVAREVVDVYEAYVQGRQFRWQEVAGWPVDFLLWFSLAQALVLHRSARQMGSGWIGRCWTAMAWGVFLICLGVVAIWAGNWGYLPWPWSALTWYIWLPAGAAFAMAPAYQLEAMRRASAGR